MRAPFLAAKVALLVATVGLGACGKNTDAPAGIAATDIVVGEAYIRAPRSNAPGGATAGFLTLTAPRGDALLAATVPDVDATEVHTMAMANGVMQMRKLDRLDLPPGQPVRLVPGGDHLMLIGLSSGFGERDTVEVTLTFEKAGDLTLSMPVKAR